MTILDNILAVKQTEVERLLQQEQSFATTKTPISLTKKIRGTKKLQVIAEIKRASPSRGNIQTNIAPATQAKLYEKYGAVAISVLTDSTFFQGSIHDLKQVAEAVNIPVLCKDFIIHPIQIDQAKAAGASIILLIVAILSEQQLNELHHYATNQGLEVICEVHNKKELQRAFAVNPAIIGINNRNLKNFSVSLKTTEELTPYITAPNTIIISESGICSKTDALFARDAGADALLVGETLMRSNNLRQTIQSFQVERKQANAR
ncbi:indole-3-glycerol phosphate synthase [Virgibacillus dokdonensis]|uniref:Indole-3-glycerol phosphate synthase n=1 Tax=Virgibacillus dokdonensis TaxID=302167 RepID=A0A3E0WGV6_9BACI|nr:indole-3-glycerol phosphate synthase TrpC [Virgibacillus dokdonensis]RFA31988.1 indole-3-glycerol phosphate synthase [Virgibacillus dokdonensis]